MRAAELSEAELAERFQEWFLRYPRKIALGAARKAYDRAIRSGKVTPDELLQGVMVYAAARNGEDHRYTILPAKWLQEERWRDDAFAISPRRRTRATINLVDRIAAEPLWTSDVQRWIRVEAMLKERVPGDVEGLLADVKADQRCRGYGALTITNRRKDIDLKSLQKRHYRTLASRRPKSAKSKCHGSLWEPER